LRRNYDPGGVAHEYAIQLTMKSKFDVFR